MSSEATQLVIIDLISLFIVSRIILGQRSVPKSAERAAGGFLIRRTSISERESPSASI